MVPTKSVADEVGYTGRLAETAAVLFDELGLDGYAAICRSGETAKVHAAFDQSDKAGRTAIRKAIEGSGIDPPDLDDFEWSSVKRTEEAHARSAVEAALEEAIYTGEMAVGAKGWRNTQAKVCAAVLDSDHPEFPGQSWRTALVTERIEQWVSAAEHRSPKLAEARAQTANQLLQTIEMHADAGAAMRPLMWLLDRWGDEQPLTQAGYLKPAFVQSLQADRPWSDALPLGRPVKTELDDRVLLDLRARLQRVGALRKHKATLRRTPLGREIAADPVGAWQTLTRNLAGGDDWDSFVAETGLLFLLSKDEPISDSSPPVFVRNCAIEMGWQTTTDGVTDAPSLQDVSWTFIDARHVWDACGLTNKSGDWRNRQITRTSAGLLCSAISDTSLPARKTRHGDLRQRGAPRMTATPSFSVVLDRAAERLASDLAEVRRMMSHSGSKGNSARRLGRWSCREIPARPRAGHQRIRCRADGRAVAAAGCAGRHQ